MAASLPRTSPPPPALLRPPPPPALLLRPPPAWWPAGVAGAQQALPVCWATMPQTTVLQTACAPAAPTLAQPVVLAQPCSATAPLGFGSPRVLTIAQQALPGAGSPAGTGSLQPGSVAGASLNVGAPVRGGGHIAGVRQFVNPKAFALKYNFKGDFCINGRPMLLHVDPIDSERSYLATGLRVWDGGIVLAKYLEWYVPSVLQSFRKPKLQGLELGCGTGIAGLSFALMGQNVILSDLGDLQEAATKANIAQNGGQIMAAGGSAAYELLDWRSLPARGRFGPFDLVFAGDVIWHESLVEPFLSAVSWACSGPGATEVLLSHKVRDGESVALWERSVGKAGLAVERRVPTESVLGEDGHPDIFVYHLRRR